jgi:hypothetical protein
VFGGSLAVSLAAEIGGTLGDGITGTEQRYSVENMQ